MTYLQHRFSTLWQYHLVQVLAGFAILFLSTQIEIPIRPVAITLQTVGVMLVALSLSQKAAMHSILSYVILGTAGLPVFTYFQGGLAKLLGPSGGYLIGFIVAVYVMSKAKERLGMTSPYKIFLNCMLGSLCIYSFGIAWLSYSLGSFEKGLTLGLLPFIFPGLIKAVLLSIALRYIHGDKA
ncbi:MAG: biotin transporter BioY [Alphaproteobacteria bacterium]|nr:biotin transporter BioY [Alphaproteobacteria bacterium]